MIELIGGGRPMRVCDVCGGFDDHPRHVFATVGGAEPSADAKAKFAAAVEGASLADVISATREFYDPTTQSRHMDCCRGAGCPDGSCDAVAAKTGADLLKTLTKES